ncbi:hypothetical protein MAM1_1129d11473, partial [Mucor ambiguus]
MSKGCTLYKKVTPFFPAKIQTKPTIQSTPTVTSNSRLTLTKQTTTGSCPSKLPVASRKRRHSTIKATIVPTHRSPRNIAPTVNNPPMNMQSTNAATASTSGISDATITCLRYRHEIYSQISILSNDSKKQAARLDQFQDLLQRNQELQLALDQAHVKIVELEAQASRSSPISPTANRMTPVPEKRPDGSSTSKWADVAATPPLNDSPTKSQTPKTPSPPKATTSSKPVSKGKRFYSDPPESHGYQFLYFTSRGREAISKIRAGFQV